MKGFLGLFNFYWRVMPQAATIIRLLMDVLKGSKKGTAAISWTAKMRSTDATLLSLSPVQFGAPVRQRLCAWQRTRQTPTSMPI
jgi:hypothetical protein